MDSSLVLPLLCLLVLAFLLGWFMGNTRNKIEGARERWAARRKMKTIKDCLPNRPEQALELTEYFIFDYEYKQEKDPEFWRY